ncbi:MAG TPA: malto-oligosyltrehalose synthase [Stellaceae bacterium]|nr:malto-oligosyltrehalose synthase [Stellaceae bacterium]
MAPPRATYRLQFHRGFTFRDALALVPYLAALGVSHVYASPLTEARPGSTHGYDIVNHQRLNPEIGTEDEFRALARALRDHGMGLVLDIVPNHMGVGADNAWWVDVLEWGEASPYARYFDINWEDGRPDLRGRVLLPVLGDQYGAILEAGEIELRFDTAAGSFSFWYYEHRFPASPLSYARILTAGGATLGLAIAEFLAVRDAESGAWSRAPRAKKFLAEAAREPETAAAIEAAVRSWHGKPGDPASFRPLHRLLEAQAYRLAYWRVAADEINYRRFFNINDLAGIRVELPELFAETHRLIFTMAERGEIDGVRIDHIDGLFDPAAYLADLRRHLPDRYIVVEKILAWYETLPDWPIDGSTGYEFVNQLLELFVDPAGERAMTRLYRRLTGRSLDFDGVLQNTKRRIMDINLASEMNVLAHRFHRLSMSDWRTRDFTVNGMLAALRQVIGAFPVYRTYVSERGASAEDHRFIDWAIAQAKKQTRTADTSIFDFLHRVLTGEAASHLSPEDTVRTAMQFQQVTGPVMAKSAEDTAFYRDFRLLALNEVGGDPRRFGLSLAGFHHLMRERARAWPGAMNATATHDTKRGEDGRIRLAMLSEMPRQWGQSVSRWLRFNRSRRSEVDGEVVPDRNVEYLFYQTLVGAWPPGLTPYDAGAMSAFAERIGAYMIKAVREGKEESSWSNPNQAYEAALSRFVAMVLDGTRPNTFLADFHGFIGSIARLSAISSLAQLAIKLTAPGVPDVYQGCELWDFSLVDPDNRRPPDWDRRRDLLPVVAQAEPAALAADWCDGREKLLVASRLLALRRDRPALFLEGAYLPLYGEGGRGDDHLCAFARQQAETTLVVAAPRLVYRLYHGGDSPEWGATVLPLPGAGRWRDVLTGRDYGRSEHIAAAELFTGFPVAALLCADD